MFCHTKNKNRIGNKKGFTYIELLVAIVLLVIILGLVVTVMNGSVKTYDKSVSTSEAELLSNTIMQIAGDEVIWAIEITSPTTGNSGDELEYTSTNYGKGILKNTTGNRIAFQKDGETVPTGLLNDASYSSGLSANVSFEAIKAEGNNQEDIIKVTVKIMDSEGAEIRTDEEEFQRINGWQLDSSESASLMNMVDPSKVIQEAIKTCSEDSDSGWVTQPSSNNIDSNATSGTNSNLITKELEKQGFKLQQYGINYWCVSNYSFSKDETDKYDSIVISWTDVDLSTSSGKYVRAMRYSFATTRIGITNPIEFGYSVGYVYCGNGGNGYNVMAFPSNTIPVAPTGSNYLKHYMIGSNGGNTLELEEAYNIYRNLESTLTPTQAQAWFDAL